MHWIKSDGIGNQYYWFYFRVDGVAQRTVTFELTNLIADYHRMGGQLAEAMKDVKGDQS